MQRSFIYMSKNEYCRLWFCVDVAKQANTYQNATSKNTVVVRTLLLGKTALSLNNKSSYYLGKLVDPAKFQFPYEENGDNNTSNYFSGILCFLQ